ncbi:hypothetical protein [Microbacterium aurum]
MDQPATRRRTPTRRLTPTGLTRLDKFRSTTTFDNGFAGFWVPRSLQGTIEVTYGGRSGTTPFSTTGDAATCITTLQLT